MRLLWVAGGRDYQDKATIQRVLTPFLTEDLELVTGAARGADYLAELFWRSMSKPYLGIPADWTRGKNAGFLRNEVIAKLNPVLLLAFPGGPGTKMSVDLAIRYGINFTKVQDD